MKRLKSKHTGVIFGFNATMAENTKDYEVIEDTPALKPKAKRKAKPKAKKTVKDTEPTQTVDDLDGILDGLENL